MTDRYLLPTEQVVFRIRRHWMAMAEVLSFYFAYIIGGFTVLALFNNVELVRLFAASFIVLSTLWISWFILDWYKEELIVTDKRVVLITGLITRRVAIMPVSKVTDLTFEQTILGRILNYGSFLIESAGQVQGLDNIKFLSAPEMHYQQISQVLFGPKVESPVPVAVVEAAPHVFDDEHTGHENENETDTSARSNEAWRRRIRRRAFERPTSSDFGDDRSPSGAPEVAESDYARGGRLWS